MSYYVVKTSFESGEVNKNGDPVIKKAEFLVSGESVLDVETKMAEYLDGSVGGFETTQVTKSKIEAVVGN
jgi:hypothetical protein